MKTRSVKSVQEQNAEAFKRAFPSGRKPVTTEWHVQKNVCHYLRANYPQLRFYSSLDGFNLGDQRSLLSSIQWINEDTGEMGGFPDLLIFGKRILAIELKRPGVVVGKDKHTIKQQGWLEHIRQAGIRAEFAIGYDEAIKLINEIYGKVKC